MKRPWSVSKPMRASSTIWAVRWCRCAALPDPGSVGVSEETVQPAPHPGPGQLPREGAANTLSYLWDSWYKSSRRSWQRLLSADSRRTATEVAPELSTSRHIDAPTRYENPNRFAIPQLPLVAEFHFTRCGKRPASSRPRASSWKVPAAILSRIRRPGGVALATNLDLKLVRSAF